MSTVDVRCRVAGSERTACSPARRFRSGTGRSRGERRRGAAERSTSQWFSRSAVPLSRGRDDDLPEVPPVREVPERCVGVPERVNAVDDRSDRADGEPPHRPHRRTRSRRGASRPRRATARTCRARPPRRSGPRRGRRSRRARPGPTRASRRSRSPCPPRVRPAWPPSPRSTSSRSRARRAPSPAFPETARYSASRPSRAFPHRPTMIATLAREPGRSRGAIIRTFPPLSRQPDIEHC